MENTRTIYGSFHISTSKGTNQEQKAYNAHDVQKWINHNLRHIEIHRHKKLKSLIDFKKTKFNQVVKVNNNWDYQDPQTFKNWINSLVNPELIANYNKGKKKSRQVKDFYEYSTKDKTKSLADQIIVSLGDEENFRDIKEWFVSKKGREFWVEYQKEILRWLTKQLPNFKIYNSVLHLDETTPHLHIIGVNLITREKFKHGLPIQIANAELFGKNNYQGLRNLHNELRKLNQMVIKNFNELIRNELKLNLQFQVPNDKKYEVVSKRFDNLEIKKLMQEVEQIKNPKIKNDLLNLYYLIQEKLDLESNSSQDKKLALQVKLLSELIKSITKELNHNITEIMWAKDLEILTNEILNNPEAIYEKWYGSEIQNPHNEEQQERNVPGIKKTNSGRSF